MLSNPLNLRVEMLRAQIQAAASDGPTSAPATEEEDDALDRKVLEAYVSQQIQHVRDLQRMYVSTVTGGSDVDEVQEERPAQQQATAASTTSHGGEATSAVPPPTHGDGGNGGSCPGSSHCAPNAARSSNTDAMMQQLLCAPAQTLNWLPMFTMYRRQLYMDHAARLNHTAGNHAFYKLMHWCDEKNVFIHPSIRIVREPSAYRDYKMVLVEPVSKHCPLIAVPEQMCIGFSDMQDRANSLPTNDLTDDKRSKDFAEATGAGDSDVCQFFFDALGMLVSDLLTALNSPLTDHRSTFAQSLHKGVRTLMNAPYFDDDMRFGKEDTALADVLLQMIRNYVLGGPLVGKVDRDVLKWAVSLCLSHATPLCIGANKSIGIIPVVHLLPHGGEHCNAVVIARSTRRDAGKYMSTFFKERFGFDFSQYTSANAEPKWIYVVPTRDLNAGEEVLTEAMAPVCDKATEAEHMWRLSCGTAPQQSMPTAKLTALQADTVKEIVARGREYLKATEQ